jgi:hypothetical protein
MVDVARVEAACVWDVISVVTEFMVDVVRVEAQHMCDLIACDSECSLYDIFVFNHELCHHTDDVA